MKGNPWKRNHGRRLEMLFPNGNPLAAKVMIADQDEMIKVDHLATSRFVADLQNFRLMFNDVWITR